MILQALYQYYEAMLKAERIAAPGLEEKPIRWIIVIKEDGSFVRIEDRKDDNDKKSKGQNFLVCAGKKRSGICPPAQPFWDNRKYILGFEEGAEGISPCVDRLESFKALMNDISELYPQNKSFKAVCNFYQKYCGTGASLPEDAHTEQILSEDWITFQLQGDTELVATQSDAYHYATQSNESEEKTGICLITGEKKPLAAFHARILAPGSQSGATIASFNDAAYLSYGKKQGENAPISKYASFAHTTAFNNLLKNENTHYFLGDISYVFWNSDVANDEINSTFRTVTFGMNTKDEDIEEPSETEGDEPRKRRRNKKAKAPNPLQDNFKVLEQFKSIRGDRGKALHNDDTRQFFVLGITAGGRIAIKFWQQGTIAEIFDNTYQHLVDMNIVNWENVGSEENPPLRSLYGIVKTVSTPTKSGNFEANLIQSIVESILTGMPYPLTLQQACINRITAERTITELRAAVLKACINRKIRKANNNHITELKMALDKENTNIAYLAGRLFAVLEQIQSASLGIGVNATIRDRFYGSASTRPNTVMGRLIALSNHHLAKLRKDKPGWAIHFEKQLEELFALYEANVPVFPAVFSLDEQSIFAVGYYHQKAFREQKAGETEDKQNESTEKELF